MVELNKIYVEDCLLTLDRMEDNYLDLTVTSPPYNVDLGVSNKKNETPYDLYNDNKEHKEYISWLKDIFTKVYHKTKVGGKCVINIGSGANGKIPTNAHIVNFMEEIGWLTMSQIIWDKKNVGGSRTAWGSFNSPSCPSFPTPFEYILIFAKDEYKIQWKGETDLEKDEFIKWSLAMWTFPGASKAKSGGHPAPFPEELPKRCIKMLTWKDSIVYDPFIGSGTTALACKHNGRYYIGSEISEEYVKIAESRLDENENK